MCGEPLRRGRHRVGYVFQNPEHQFVATTVATELAAGGATPERVEELLDQFHLVRHRCQHPLTLSGGQARRLSVATIAADPRPVVVLDEPTYGQDWASTGELLRLIESLRAQGRTVVMATHDLELATEHCTHLVALPLDPASATPLPGGTHTYDASTAGEARAVAPPPRRRRSPYASLNPLTLFLAGLGPILALLVVGDLRWNVAALAAGSVLLLGAGLPWRRTLALVAAPWLVAALMTYALSTLVAADAWQRLYAVDRAPLTGTLVGAAVGILLLSGCTTDPESFIRALTTTVGVPYRIGAAGTAAVAFLGRLHQDLRLLRTARTLRGVGARWGPAAPLVRWGSSLLPLTVLAVQHAERVALSMDSRAFGAHPRRTELRDEPWRGRDWLVVALAWAGALALVTTR